MFDVLTIAAVADELAARTLDGRVQRAGLLSKLAVGMEIYAGGRRSYLIASAENDDPRVLLAEREPSFDSQLVTPLSLLLRKYARGGFVVGVEQPPLERIVRLSIAKRFAPHNAADPAMDLPDVPPDEDDPDPEGLEGATYVHLVIEIMGRHSNILLVDDDGRVMDAAKRVTSRMSRVRPIFPRVPYSDPPLGDRADPRRLSTAEATMLLGSEKPAAALATVLPRRLRGMSPQMAREIAYRAFGRADASVADAAGDGAAALSRETRRLLEPLLTSAWEPTLYRDDDGEPVAFAAIPLEHLTLSYTAESLPSISRAALLAEGGEERESPGRHAQRRARLLAAIADGRARVATRLASLQAQATKGEQAEALRHAGETIYAYLWAIKPGQSELDADGAKIALDPSLSPSDNAQAYFERYRKAQSAGAHLPALIEAAETEIAYLDQVALLATQAGNFPELEDVAMEWEAYRVAHDGKGGGKKRPRSTPPRRTRALLDHHGNAIYLGRSSIENDRITFDIAGPNDTWLHARGVPGSHVIVRWANPAADEDEATLAIAAGLAAYYSTARASATVEVDIARRRHVRKIKGAGPGMVTYRNERTVSVRPQDLER